MDLMIGQSTYLLTNVNKNITASLVFQSLFKKYPLMSNDIIPFQSSEAK